MRPYNPHNLTSRLSDTFFILLKAGINEENKKCLAVTEGIKDRLNPLGATYAEIRVHQERQLIGFIQTSFKLILVMMFDITGTIIG
jgi:hypothetical protein